MADIYYNNTAKKNPYDARRQSIQAEGEEDSQRKEEALRNSLVGAWVSDSGIALGQQRTQDRDLRMETGRRMTAVDTEQMANEEENNRELQRQGFLTSERQGGQEFSAGESAKARALQESLGMKGFDLQKQGLDQNKELTLGSQALQKQGLDQSATSDAARLALEKELGMGSQSIAREGLAQNKELTLGSQALQRDALNQSGEQFNASQAQAKELALKGLGLQESAQELQRTGMSQEDARYYAGLAQAQTLATRGLDLQQTAQELQKQGMDAEEARFVASMAHDTEQSALNRTAASDSQDKAIQAGKDLATFNATHSVELANLNAGLQKDYATFEDAINDLNTTGDQTEKVKMLALSEKLAGLDPKTDPNFMKNIDLIINGEAPIDAPAEAKKQAEIDAKAKADLAAKTTTPEPLVYTRGRG